jgi:DNA repair protein RadC
MIMIQTQITIYATTPTSTENEIIATAKNILARRFQRGMCIESPENCRDYLVMHLAEYEHEVFFMTFLDSRHRVIAHEIITMGTLNSAFVHPREIIKRSLKYNASAVILAHNHPSGSTEPSRADKEITQQIKQALALVDVRMLDHIIVGAGGDCASFAEMGLL